MIGIDAGGLIRQALGKMKNAVSGKQLRALFIPLFIEYAFTYGVNILNSSVIGSSGMAALSAVNMVDTYISMVSTMFIGVAMGGSIVVAHLHGAGRYKEMGKAAAGAISFVTLFGALLSVISIVFGSGINHFLFAASAKDVLAIADYYIRWNSASLVLYAFYASNVNILRGMGESRSSLIISLTSLVVLIGGNLFFVKYLGMSVTGLIISVTVSRAFACISSFIVVRFSHSALRGEFAEYFHLDRQLVGRIIRFGFPVAIENLLFNGGRLVLQSLISSSGTNHIAAYNISYSLMTVAQTLDTALCYTIFTAAGMCIGASRTDELRKLYKKIYIVNVAASAVIEALMLIFHTGIISIFHAEDSMYPEILLCLAIILTAQTLAHTSGFMDTYVLRAAGDVIFTSVISVLSMAVFRVLGSYVLIRVFGLGIPGVFWAMTLDWTFRAIVFEIRYRSGKWERIHVM